MASLPTFSLGGKTALVTGAGRGLGVGLGVGMACGLAQAVASQVTRSTLTRPNIVRLAGCAIEGCSARSDQNSD